MNIKKSDDFSTFIKKMQDSEDYLKIDGLKDKYSYKIYARNAYVGVWLKSKKSFMISRYKVGSNPDLFHECHWDIGTPFGTVKPLELIELCPFQIKKESNYNKIERQELLKYLDKLEENNPIINGYNSLQNRKSSAVNFQIRLAKKDNEKPPVHEWLAGKRNPAQALCKKGNTLI